MPGTHHKYSPSAAARIIECPGSVRMQAQYPEETSDDAEEGTMLHAVMAAGGADDEALTMEQRLLIEKCNAYTVGVVPPGYTIHREVHVQVRDLAFRLITEGTCDLAAVSPDGGRAVIIDWKFGRGEVPPPYSNWQLALYACGAAQKFGVAEVEAHIFQPRGDLMMPYTFRDFDAITRQFSDAIAVAESDVLELSPSKSACQYCRARRDCPALRLLAETPSKIDELNAGNIADAYDRAKAAEIWADAVIEHAKKLAAAGPVQGLALSERPGDRKIEDAAAAFAECADNLTQAEFMQLVKVPVTALEEALARRLIEKHTDAKRMTVKAAKDIAGTIIKRFSTRGENKKVLERTR